ncbi:MAG: hypothetical protein Q7L07_10705 [Pseudohongiella sp.]|nr:hypothetical protein [Pseudohongiella sp.]
MAGIKKTSISRVLLIQNDKASLFAWDRRHLELLARFASNPADLQEFTNVLNLDTESSLTVVADFIEEDFRLESVAHVQGRDRTEMLKRKQMMLFRNTPYRIWRILGRERTGRRDDNVLFSALTKPELLTYWLQPVLTAKIAIRALTSASYLMEYLAKHEGLQKHEHLLLINVEPLSGIRQTYLHKGKVLFSRLVPNRPGSEDAINLLIEEQSIQTRKYLERVKLVPYDLVLETRIFRHYPDTVMPEARISDLMHFVYQDTFNLKGHDLVEIKGADTAGCLLPVLARGLKTGSIVNTYGPALDRRYHVINLIKKGLVAASMTAIIVSLLISTPTLLTALDNSEQAARLQQQTQPLLSNYELLRESFPETPIPSNSMALIVQTYDKLVPEVYNPRELLATVSRAISASPGIRLGNLEWVLEEQTMGAYPELNESQSFMQASLDNLMQLKVKLEGNVLETFSIREAHEQVQDLMRTLEAQTGGVVTPVNMPLDVSAVSALELSLDDEPVAASFVLEVLIRPQSAEELAAQQEGVTP